MFQEVVSACEIAGGFDDYALALPLTVVSGARSTPSARAMAHAIEATNEGSVFVSLGDVGHMAPLTDAGSVGHSLAEHFRRVGLTAEAP